MIGPYKIIDETGTHITYQYNSLYSWILIAILILLLTGMYIENVWLESASVALIALYFFAKLVIGSEVNSDIRNALKNGKVELSGGKYSFSNPLTIKVPKNI